MARDPLRIGNDAARMLFDSFKGRLPPAGEEVRIPARLRVRGSVAPCGRVETSHPEEVVHKRNTPSGKEEKAL